MNTANTEPEVNLDILDDPNIDVIFIPLPNSLHYEWAVRSIRSGKHVLLEKPATANAVEASKLFNMPELQQPGAPVILEAFHGRFHPAIQLFKSFITPTDVVHASATGMVPWVLADKDGIEFNYDMAGGCIMHLGAYNFALLRTIFTTEPDECLSCETTTFQGARYERCDKDFKASFRFPNGGIGEASSTLWGSIIWKPSEAKVTHREIFVPDVNLPDTQEKLKTRVVTMHGFMNAFLWHRVDVEDRFVIRQKADKQPVKQWVQSSSHKGYTYKESGGDSSQLESRPWWMSYRFQLEQFVKRIKGEEAQYWITGEDSIGQMRMIDLAYEKSGLGLRPTSTFV
jgi:predicted dehydrogenase